MRRPWLLLGAALPSIYGQTSSPPPPFPPQSYFQTSVPLTNRWGPNTRECYTADGVLATAPSQEYTGTLEEAQQKCSVTPDCTVVYDWGCDGVNWKYCKLVTAQRPATVLRLPRGAQPAARSALAAAARSRRPRVPTW